MTDRGKFRLFRSTSSILAALAALSSACSTADPKSKQAPSLATASPSPSASPTQEIALIKPVAFPSNSSAKAGLSTSSASDGSIVLITVQAPSAKSKLSAEFEGTELPFNPAPGKGESAFEAVLGVPYNHKPGAVKVTVSLDGEKLDLPFQIVAGNYKSEILKTAGRYTNPKKKDLIRIKQDTAEVGQIYKTITPQKYWTGPFRLPVDSVVTSPFGTKRVFNGEMKSFHQGLDLRAGVGTPIHAAGPGKVALAKDLFFTGNTVLLDHGYGVFTLYAHMSKLEVKLGDVVQAGQELGLAGKTGRVSGPHLHWGAIIHRAKVNPIYLTEVMH